MTHTVISQIFSEFLILKFQVESENKTKSLHRDRICSVAQESLRMYTTARV